MFGGNFAPRGWALCDGQLLSISSNQALFSILGTVYGGDGRTTFGLPELRGRVAIHAGNGPGLTNRPLGVSGGTETNTLNVNQLPPHSHPASLGASEESPNSDDPTGGILATTNIYHNSADETVPVTVGNTGSSQSVNNIQPFRTVNYIIALQGTFPSRN